ncbi:MAG TPA: diguanylate cyclase [Bacillales bacterium]
MNRYKLLYQITKKIYSSMDVNGVLREIISGLNGFYPSFECQLLLSHENGDRDDLPVVHLDYGKNTDTPMASKAFLTGRLQFEPLNGKPGSIYAPLRGNQGVYGVLQVKVPDVSLVSDSDIELIKLVAGTGGNALENAQLYEQSQRLITDLQLINKISHKLNSNLCLSDSIRFMVKQIICSFDAEEVGFILFRPPAELKILEGSTPYFQQSGSRPFLKAASDRMIKDREALFIGDLFASGEISASFFHSFMGVPMIQNGEFQGMVVVLHRNSYQFSFDEFKLLQSLVHHSTLALTNSILHEELQRMVITDYLTGLHVRHYLDEQIEFSIGRDGCGSFILLDIDDFKAINDTYGHQVGDRILVQVAEIIRQNVRKVDVAARWGGEELAVYLPGVERERGLLVAQRLVERIGRGTRPEITASCGISYWDAEMKNDTAEMLFARADRALYTAKGSGKNQVIHEGKKQTDISVL